jgi:hypothetical protein
MSRSKQTSKIKRPRKAVTAALGVAGALSLASGASASTAPTGDIPTNKTAPVILAEEEISDVSLSTFYLRRLRRLRVGLLYLDWTCPRLLIAGDTHACDAVT